MFLKKLEGIKKKIGKFVASHFLYRRFSRPIIPYRINLVYWTNVDNVGDHLSKIIFDFVLKQKGVKNGWNKRTICISFIGSVIAYIYRDSIVYGSGLLSHSDEAFVQFSNRKIKLDVRAVRGPLTKQTLEGLGYEVPNVFGDPAILLPLFYTPKISKEVKEYIVIPHWTKTDDYKKYPYLSTMTKDWQTFIDSICSSKLVISSSLHGIILAESYGVPAILLNDTEGEKSLFKYDDYYHSTGRFEYPLANSVEEALTLVSAAIPNFEQMKKDLLDAFPIDLFSS